MIKRYVGSRTFYRQVAVIAIPIIIQNGITNFVSLLDNIMIGQVGTLQMSGVSIVNQLIFVFNLCIFGASSGAGIFTAQFHGSQDHTGIRHTFRFKILSCLLLSFSCIILFLLGGNGLISVYLLGEGNPQDAADVLMYGHEYLEVMLWGFVPFALSNAYASTLRETGQTTIPMVGGILAVFVNLILNCVLIFGLLGAPAMGVQGAALATVISRYVELVFVGGWTHFHGKLHPFIRGAYRSIHIPKTLLFSIFRKGTPLLANEFLWAAGMAFLNQCYSTCGLDVVPAMNISSTLYNLSSVAFISMGNAVGILMGQMLGAGKPKEEIRSSNRQLIFLSIFAGVVFAGIMAAISGLFPLMYNTSDSVRLLAMQLICICAIFMPIHSFINAAYFTLRSGGQTLVTFLFDSCFVWTVCVPLAFCLSRFTPISILPLYAITQAVDLIKCAIGTFMIRKGSWIQNLTKS